MVVSLAPTARSLCERAECGHPLGGNGKTSGHFNHAGRIEGIILCSLTFLAVNLVFALMYTGLWAV